MAHIIKSLSLDVSRQNRVRAILAKQFDNDSRFLKIQLNNEGEPIAVAPTSTVLINATRADGESESFSGYVNDDGSVTVPITYWMLEVTGRVKCDISVISEQGSKLSSLGFVIQVEKANGIDGEIADADGAGILVQLISDVENLKKHTVLEVDAELSLESENPIQNKAVTQEFRAFNDAIGDTNRRVSALEKGGLGGGGGVSSWKDLTDKPFGENEDGTVRQLDNKYLEPFELQAGEEKDVLPLHSIEGLGVIVEGSIYAAGLPIFPLTEGEIYNVAWNDDAHTCTAKLVTFNGAPTMGLGNFALAGLGEDTGEPFLIGVGADGLSAAVYTTTSDTPITVRVYQSIPNKWLLKEEYLPFGAIAAYIDDYIDEALGGDY